MFHLLLFLFVVSTLFFLFSFSLLLLSVIALHYDAFLCLAACPLAP